MVLASLDSRSESDLLPLVNTAKSAKRTVFHVYLIISMVMVWSAHSILIRHTMEHPDGEDYYPATVVVMSEGAKLIISAVLLAWENRHRPRLFVDIIAKNLLWSPVDMLKMSVPSLCYTIQNNVEFVALDHLRPSVFVVISQLKVVTTVIFMVIILKRSFSCIRWIAILLVTCGVCLVSVDANATTYSTAENTSLGVFAVLVNCLLAGFAGVYCEKLLKETAESLWIRNMQLYLWGLIFALVSWRVEDNAYFNVYKFFHGYDVRVWLIVLTLCVGGIYVSLVMKHMDNLMKSFAAATTIISVTLLSVAIFHHSLSVYFVLGAITVCGGIATYNMAS